MSGYSAYWRTTIFAAIAFHFLTALGFSYVLPHLMPEPKIEDVAEFEWVDVDLLPPDVTVIEAEAIPTETVQEVLPTFKAQDLFVPDLTIPEPVFVEETPPLSHNRRRKSSKRSRKLNNKFRARSRPKKS